MPVGWAVGFQLPVPMTLELLLLLLLGADLVLDDVLLVLEAELEEALLVEEAMVELPLPHLPFRPVPKPQ